MATYVAYEYISSRPTQTSSSKALRAITPAPEKRPLSTTLVLRPDVQSGIADHGSPAAKRPQLISKHEYSVGHHLDPAVLKSATSIDLPFPMIVNGEVYGPTKRSDWDLILSIFPTTVSASLGMVFLTIVVRTLPSRPWPLLIGGYPLHIATDKHDDPIDNGVFGRSRDRVLKHYDLKQSNHLTQVLLTEIVVLFESLNVRVYNIMYFRMFFRIVVADGTDLKTVPFMIANRTAFYKFFSEQKVLQPSALGRKQPDGVIQDDHNYLEAGNSLLRPGMMLSSSRQPDGMFKSTTSGILIVDRVREPLITVVSHVFNEDGEVWHPNPDGVLVGKIIHIIPDTDISVVKLNAGLRYINETFDSPIDPNNTGRKATSLTSGYPPHTRAGDRITMNNPFTGFTEGQILAVGADISKTGDMIPHIWILLNNGTEPLDGSCGTPILDDKGQVVAFSRYMAAGNRLCYAVCASELTKARYEIGEGEVTF